MMVREMSETMNLNPLEGTDTFIHEVDNAKIIEKRCSSKNRCDGGDLCDVMSYKNASVDGEELC